MVDLFGLSDLVYTWLTWLLWLALYRWINFVGCLDSEKQTPNGNVSENTPTPASHGTQDAPRPY